MSTLEPKRVAKQTAAVMDPAFAGTTPFSWKQLVLHLRPLERNDAEAARAQLQRPDGRRARAMRLRSWTMSRIALLWRFVAQALSRTTAAAVRPADDPVPPAPDVKWN
jgi:hypothetical protein